jgi:hypothetical protein
LKFRRKSSTSTEPTAPETDAESAPDTQAESETAAAGAGEPVQLHGPYDADDMPPEAAAVERVDLGSLLLPPVEGLELRLQVDEASGAIAAVLLTAEDGALELRAFAAPRGGDLWAEVWPQLEADVAQRGGQSVQREGAFGTELVCQLGVTMPDGSEGVQPSRIVGINGDRWLLRATFLGRPAMEVEAGEAWEQVLRYVAVRRGKDAMPKGEALPLVMPPQARRVE